MQYSTAIASRPFYSAENAHVYYILPRDGSVSLSVRRRSEVLRVATMPPSKVSSQCKAIRQKGCKSCEHVFRAKRISEHTPISACYIYCHTHAYGIRACAIYTNCAEGSAL